MTDDELSAETAQTPEPPELPDPPEIVEVRRLLAEARHIEPMPEDVTARLDAALAGLREEISASEPAVGGEGRVVPISAHRRRRAAALLVAAAAVVVGGVVVAPHVGGKDTTSGGAAASSAEDSAGGAELGTTGNTGNSGDASSPSTPTRSQLARLAPIHHGRVVVRPQSFAAAAMRGQVLLHQHTAKNPTNMDLDGTSCVDLPRATNAVDAEYEHAPAVLVYRRARGGSQVVDLFVCGSSRPIRSTTLPAP